MLLLQVLGGALLLLGSALVIGTIVALDAPARGPRPTVVKLPQPQVMPERKAA